MKKFLILLALVLFATTVAFAGGTSDQGTAGGDQYEIVMVVKLEGVAWFDNMRLGIQDFSNDHDDVNAYQIGADTADPAAQVGLVEDLIAKGFTVTLPTDKLKPMAIPVGIAPVMSVRDEEVTLSLTVGHLAVTEQMLWLGADVAIGLEPSGDSKEES